MAAAMAGFRVGVDIGGTFTDIVLHDDGGRVHTRKVSSSVDDYARAIAEGLAGLFEELGLAGERRSPRCAMARPSPRTRSSSTRARSPG